MYPFLFAPVLLEKVWGGRRLSAFGKQLKAAVGESWEVADLATTSAGGAGGQGISSIVTNGPLTGRSLHELMKLVPLVPASHPATAYPLLVKFLDAAENLSVQVHPSPAYARENPSAALKSECWYILAAQPEAKIYKGLQPGTTKETFQKALTSGKGIADLLVSVPAIVGECHYLPSGTCHALGAGALVLEVQTSSDTTFRIFDWGRTGRELHIPQALACIDFENPAPAAVTLRAVPREGPIPAGSQITTPDFQVFVRHIGPEGLDLTTHVGPFTVIAGRGSMVNWLAGNRPISIKAGMSGIMPILRPAQVRPRLVGEGATGMTVLFAGLLNP